MSPVEKSKKQVNGFVTRGLVLSKWSYFANVIVYCYNRAEKEDTAVVFWNHKTGDVSKNTS